MQQLQYRHAPEYEQMTPLPPGTYGPPVWKRLLMMLTAFLAFLAGGIMLLFSLANDPRTAGDWVRIVAAFVCAVFVLPAGFVWLFQAMKITLETARARIPMPRSARVQFADVHAIVVFPAVLTAGRDMKLLALLNAEGVSIKVSATAIASSWRNCSINTSGSAV